jgi:hypothetical protein
VAEVAVRLALEERRPSPRRARAIAAAAFAWTSKKSMPSAIDAGHPVRLRAHGEIADGDVVLDRVASP